jgi:hypothetical protein
MPNEKSKTKDKMLSVDNLRHAEYYEMQSVFDDLYAKSKSGEEFTDLMPQILSRENILLAYRNIKTNTGSKTAGTDKLTIGDIGRLPPEKVVDKVRFILAGSPHGYRPKAVRRKDIPKPYTTRPKPDRSVFRAFGTGWYSNVSSKLWSRYAKRNSAKIRMVSDLAGQRNTQSREPISLCNAPICIMLLSLILKAFSIT